MIKILNIKMIMSKKTKIYSHYQSSTMLCVMLCVKCTNVLGVTAVINTGLSVAALDYWRRGDAKNFPWRPIAAADLLLLPNLQQRAHIMTFNGIRRQSQ